MMLAAANDGETIEFTSVDINLPELQGEPEEITRQKCLIAVEKV